MVALVKISISGNNLTKLTEKGLLIWNPPFQNKSLLFGLHLSLDYNIWRPSFFIVFKEINITLYRGTPTMRIKENLEKKIVNDSIFGGQFAWGPNVNSR